MAVLTLAIAVVTFSDAGKDGTLGCPRATLCATTPVMRNSFANLLAAGDVEEGQATRQLGFDDIDRATFLRECGGRLHTWRMLYCGGAKPVSDALTAISKDLGISFRMESFAW